MPEKSIVRIDQDLADLVPVYLENRRKDLEAIPGLAAKDDFEALRIMGHQLKGSGGGFGLDFLSELGGRLETSAVKRDKEAVLAQAAELRNFLDSLEIVYVAGE